MLSSILIVIQNIFAHHPTVETPSGFVYSSSVDFFPMSPMNSDVADPKDNDGGDQPDQFICKKFSVVCRIFKFQLKFDRYTLKTKKTTTRRFCAAGFAQEASKRRFRHVYFQKCHKKHYTQ